MDEGCRSATAEGAAVMRALHQKMDGEPKILDDLISARLVEPDSYQPRLELLKSLPANTALRLRAGFVLRSRFAEDCLSASVSEHVCQYVLLGAGLDTFAYRQPFWASSLRIFEVDHPATQQWKRKRLAYASVYVPGNVSFVAVDFEKISLADGLSQAGLDLGGAPFFSMLGVSQYLTQAAFDQTLKFILSAPARSEIVFSFVASDAVLDADDVALAREYAARMAAIGEPWLLRFLPHELVAKLAAIGFSRVFHLTPEKANERYFEGRTDSLTASILEQMIRATV